MSNTLATVWDNIGVILFVWWTAGLIIAALGSQDLMEKWDDELFGGDDSEG